MMIRGIENTIHQINEKTKTLTAMIQVMIEEQECTKITEPYMKIDQLINELNLLKDYLRNAYRDEYGNRLL